MSRKRKVPGQKPKKRPIDPLKHPRAFDRLHGMTMVEDLFENLTPKGWSLPPSPEPEEGA